MSNNTQLPVEVVEEIKLAAKAFAAGVFPGNLSDSEKREKKRLEATHVMVAKEYAAKLQEVVKTLQESDKQRKEANDELREAKKLLNEVFRKHESGLLPDRFIYEKIKTFLYGE